MSPSSRARATGEAAARLASLGPVRHDDPGEGWVPPQSWSEPAPSAPHPEVAPEPGRKATPSWSPPAAGQEHEETSVAAATVAALLRSARIDPGRQGVLALVAVALVAALLAGVVLLRSRPAEVPVVPPAVVGGTTSPAGAELVVDVAGKVRRPGIVRLPSGSRVHDAIRAAGGALPGASTGSLNLAAKLADGQQVVVGQAPGPPAAGGGAAGSGGLLDLNTATVQDFDGLPGIGPVLAERIVAWRTEHGRFGSVDQLREVSGIGESKYQAMKSKVTV